MPARPSARHQGEASAAHRLGERGIFDGVSSGTARTVGTFSWPATLARTPAATMVMRREDPPKEMKGRGIPVTGSRPITAPMLITAWLVIQQVAATASRAPKRSGARLAARNPYQARAPKSATT